MAAREADGLGAPILLKIINRVGSTQHYFHFILGFVVPALVQKLRGPPGSVFVAASHGPMDARFAELEMPHIQLIPPEIWQDLWAAGGHETAQLLGYDAPRFYDAEAFALAREKMWQYFTVSAQNAGSEILIINRGASPDFYQSAAAVRKKSAALRRAVPNMRELAARLADGGMAVCVVELEHASLADQVRMFARARVVLAQHGAALVNMLWMRPGARIMEILPPMGDYSAYFSELARVCGHDYLAIPQANSHAAIDVDLAVQLITRYLRGQIVMGST